MPPPKTRQSFLPLLVLLILAAGGAILFIWSPPKTSNEAILQEESFNPDDVYYDYSYAGYYEATNLPISYPGHRKVSVLDHGAIPNDGKDDSEAFRAALAIAAPSVVHVPKGVYDFSDQLVITQPRQVLTGDGMGNTVLQFHRGLVEIHPKPNTNSGDTKTPEYSRNGGLIEIQGKESKLHLTTVTSETERLSNWIEVANTSGFQQGDYIIARQYQNSDNSLLKHLYAGDTDDISKANPAWKYEFPARIVEIDGNRIRLDRPCRIKLSPAWKAEVFKPSWSVQDCGIEGLTIRFPKHTYRGQFKELGYNAIQIFETAHCWVREVEIVNADSGIFLKSTQCTIDNVILRSPDVQADKNGFIGHHGITLSGTNHMLRRFELQNLFIHDITLDTGTSGNVVMNGNGKNLNLDHHRMAPHANLFTRLDLGLGTRFLESGGQHKNGRHTGAWATFWNIRSRQPVKIPPGIGPKELIFVGLQVENAAEVHNRGMHISQNNPKIPNLFDYQLDKRLNSAYRQSKPTHRSSPNSNSLD